LGIGPAVQRRQERRWKKPAGWIGLPTVFTCARSFVARDWGQTRTLWSMAPGSYLAGD
jgi:hypothetical protein